MTLHPSVQFIETGRRLGHDLYRFRSPAMGLDFATSIREGFDFAAEVRITQRWPDRFERKWLQLRLGAWQRGRAFDDTVSPSLLRAIDVPVCPVTREPLTHGQCTPSDWSIDRLNNDGAYAANNLAVISTRANKAKGSLSFEEVLSRANRPDPSDGLSPAEWMRMASLMLGPCFATRPADAPCLPLAAPIPLHSVRLAMQQIQHVFTTRGASQAGKNLLIKHFSCTSNSERAQMRLRTLAEDVHLGLKGLEHGHDVWHAERVMTALSRWRQVLDDRAWGLAGEVSRRLAGSRVVPGSRLQQWALGSRGYALQ